eukprot:COSAG06_NODE_5700_length_3313_cov_3.423460_5_plen_119_part_00
MCAVYPFRSNDILYRVATGASAAAAGELSGSILALSHTEVRKRHFLSHLYIKTIFLPRQARDRHRENSKRDRFRAGLCHGISPSKSLDYLIFPTKTKRNKTNAPRGSFAPVGRGMIVA